MISFILFTVCCLLITTYSYGFLDFNLTLSSHPLFLKFVEPLQHLVYFDRPHSVQVYIVLFALLTLAFTGILGYWKTGILPKFPWKFYFVLIFILVLAYPMLSYDVFNYMFHQKILWFYHANPHLHAPLEYTGDLWLRFMRWVHTPSAYGPVFTVIEAPAYLLGFGKFVPILYLMKVTMAAFFVWSIYLVRRIGEELKMKSSDIVRAQLLLAFNPFLLLEVVVNAHNDAVMIALLLLALLLFLRHRPKLSFVSFLLSVGVKYVTAFTLPFYFIRDNRYRLFFISLLLFLPVALSPGRFQPWYLVWSLIPATIINTSWSRIWIILTSLAGLIYYVPFVATGFWNNSLPFVSLILYTPLFITMIYFFSQKSNGSNHRTSVI